ncbi:hypothetical protein MMC30_000509 [Trapelia coarctata]|nr:hypothetical protein [Trapelia coarctata]
MGTLARDNPRLSIAHCHPGLARSNTFGLNAPNPMSQDEAGQRAVFHSTNDRYAVPAGLVPVPEGLETKDSEAVLGPMRERGLDEKAWNFTQEIFSACTAKA